MSDIAASWGPGTDASWGDGVVASWGQQTGQESCDPGPIVITATLSLTLTVTLPRPPQGCAASPS